MCAAIRPLGPRPGGLTWPGRPAAHRSDSARVVSLGRRPGLARLGPALTGPRRSLKPDIGERLDSGPDPIRAPAADGRRQGRVGCRWGSKYGAAGLPVPVTVTVAAFLPPGLSGLAYSRAGSAGRLRRPAGPGRPAGRCRVGRPWWSIPGRAEAGHRRYEPARARAGLFK